MKRSASRSSLAWLTLSVWTAVGACTATGGNPQNGGGGQSGRGSSSGSNAGASGNAGAGAGAAGSGVSAMGSAGAPAGSPGAAGSAAGSGGSGAVGTAGAQGGTGGGAAGTGGSSSGAIGNGGAGEDAGTSAPDGGPPSACDWSNQVGRVALFDGSNLDNWQSTNSGGAAPWRLVGDGSMEVVPGSGNIQTKMKFDNVCLHVEYMTPMYAASVTGQSRGNSGIYFRRAYEMQVLDSYGQPPEDDGCGAVYKISKPLVVACNMQLVWNTYEIEFQASQWDASGRKTKNAVFVLATLNGQVVQRNVDLNVSNTTSGQPDAAGPQPIMLQDHNNNVRYRNIWAKIPQ